MALEILCGVILVTWLLTLYEYFSTGEIIKRIALVSFSNTLLYACP